ncbi:hypothetical protein ACQKI4_00810 [Paenibacillus glucanolyticus]|uniref:hypothetical protein n=1 Tax=Paenibacillus glucanolyticus TaxID=59843 RepID=UPI003D07C71B
MNELSEPLLLPSAQEIDDMKQDEFECWVRSAHKELPKRKEQRNPLTHLRKRISEILSNEKLTEVQKEARVLSEIERFDIIISQSQVLTSS